MNLKATLFSSWLAFGFFISPATCVQPQHRAVLAQSLQNQQNIYSFPYGTRLELIGATTTLEIDHIRFMSDTAEDEFAQRKAPEYPTVRTLAQALRLDPSLIANIPAISVWQDTWGRTFTFDHRRLLAARLAGISKMNVRWATPAEFREDQFKFSTNSMGKSIHLLGAQGEVIQTLHSGFVSSEDEKLFDRALEFALKVHSTQLYGDKLPYAYHLAAVVSALRRFGYTEIKYLVAALLHDAVEDTGVTYEDIDLSFGIEIADMVFAVTNHNDPTLSEHENHMITYAKIASTPGAVIVKLADRIANTEESIWGPMQGRKGKIEKYRRLFPEFEKALRRPGEHDEFWDYLRRLTTDGDFARRHLPSPHQRACETTLIAV